MDNRTIEQVRKNETKLINEVKVLEQQCKKYKELIDKAIEYVDNSTKPLKFILELNEENGNAYLKEFNDLLKEVLK